MPAQYEAIRDSYLKRGLTLKKAKRLAAMTYNKYHREKNPWLKEKPQPRRSRVM